MIIDQSVAIAKSLIEDAQKRYLQTVINAYPVGSRWNVKAGSAIITVEVTSHNKCWWSSAGEVCGFNLVTGSIRKWMPDQVLERVQP